MFYFDKYENVKPPEHAEYNSSKESFYRFIAASNIVLATWYISWRWLYSLNHDAIIFSLILISAETFAYIGLILFTYNLWYDRQLYRFMPPEFITECIDVDEIKNYLNNDKTIIVDILILTINEDPELVKLTIADAQNLHYPFDININIYILDDGNRARMYDLAKNMGVNYIARKGNAGFKAGNIANALNYTSGDFLVICDADTRLFPEFLDKIMGFFRNPLVAWVQTPHWFYDIDQGARPTDFGELTFGRIGKSIGFVFEKIFGIKNIMSDPFYNDGQLFFDIILRRRDISNASFCCGGSSIHRREALYEVGVDDYISRISNKRLKIFDEVFSPIKYHVSEDIYTSLLVHGYKRKKWKSILYPEILSKMLSAQDFQTRCTQLYRYAVGTIDLAINELPFSNTGLSNSQKLMYFCTIYSYFGALWNIVFLTAPIFYLFTEIAPVQSSYDDFLIHLIPFVIMNELTQIFAYRHTNQFNNKVLYIGIFWINIKALYSVFSGKKVAFNVTSKGQYTSGNIMLALPHLILFLLSITSLIYSILMVILGLSYSPLIALSMNYIWVFLNSLYLGRIVLSSIWDQKGIIVAN